MLSAVHHGALSSALSADTAGKRDPGIGPRIVDAEDGAKDAFLKDRNVEPSDRIGAAYRDPHARRGRRQTPSTYIPNVPACTGL
jgi:hypothetical protein